MDKNEKKLNKNTLYLATDGRAMKHMRYVF
jgi:hypothetical protein